MASSSAHIETVTDNKILVDFLLHVQDLGDTHARSHTALFPGKRIEGVQINHSIPDLKIEYFGHVQDVGDTAWKKEGTFVGTRGKSQRLEGIAIKLSGKRAELYNVYYCVFSPGAEQSPVVANGEYAGTRGQHKPIEGIAIWLELKATGVAPQQYIQRTDVKQDKIEQEYVKVSNYPSDIYEHIPTLYRYGLGCSKIAEFGVRSVVSTWAFLRALRDTNAPHKSLLCVDLERSEKIALAEQAAQESNISLEFIEANDLTVDLKDGVDFLFIDTWHVYPQLKRELEMHSPKVRKYIAMHDTTVDGDKGESVRLKWDTKKQAKESGFSEADIRTGLGKAIKEFLASHPEWRSREVFTNCNGLTILERVHQ